MPSAKKNKKHPFNGNKYATFPCSRTTLKNSVGFTVPQVNRIWRGTNKLKTKIVYKITETYAKVTKQIKFGLISIIKQRLNDHF